MKYFLLEYNKPAEHLVRVDEFPDYGSASVARLKAELRNRRNPDVEIVVLGADAQEDLRRTHGRYFLSTSQLVSSLGRAAS